MRVGMNIFAIISEYVSYVSEMMYETLCLKSCLVEHMARHVSWLLEPCEYF